MSPATIRIVLVDDHAVVRAGFRRLLAQQPDLQVVAEGHDGNRAYALFMEYTPDVLVIDLTMPGMSGVEAIRRIIGRDPAARILVFSMHEEASLAERALRLGARGYVTKSNAPEVLTTAVREIAAGRLYLSPDIATSIAIMKVTSNADPAKLLSPREFEIFRLLVAGRRASEIAKFLNLSAKTIANYQTLIKHKLGGVSDVELVLLAIRHNLLVS